MEQLFTKVYLDEDVHVLVADLVRARGFQISTTRDANNLGKSDEEQLQYAAQNGLAILTHNRVDFEKLAVDYFNHGRTHTGIIVIARHSPFEIAKRLLLKLNDLTADEMSNQLLYL